MNNFFYTRLAAENIKKNGKFYFPYILTCGFTAAMFYIMCFLSIHKDLSTMPGSASISMLLNLGSVVIAIFGVIFLFYTNSFLQKRRKKEFGLYNILGMEKRHIGKIAAAEALISGLLSVAGGILTGILFSKLILLFLVKLLRSSAVFSFSVSIPGILAVVFLFAGIFSLILLYNVSVIFRTKPIELLSGGNTGEREPRTKWLTALLGVIALGCGYGMALGIESPLEALVWFFAAVLLVIAGTFCLFTAGSIAVLKMMRKNKGFYYKTKHFVSVSGMLYRMKQNAAGLSNICILCTMVLVILSTTVCLYAGTEDALRQRYPNDISIRKSYDPSGKPDREGIVKTMRDTAASGGLSIKAEMDYEYLNVTFGKNGEEFTTDKGNMYSAGEMHVVTFLTQEEYEYQGGKHLGLSGNQTAVYTGSSMGDSFSLFGEKYEVVRMLKDFPTETTAMEEMMGNIYSIVVSGDDVMERIYKGQKMAYQDMASRMILSAGMDFDGKKELIPLCADQMRKALEAFGVDYMECRENGREEFNALYGGFLFIGIFLGILFLTATVLMIYYKQISEGYEDKSRFEIMQKVGMSRAEVKSSIRSQVLMVFLLPLLTAAVHVVFAYPMVKKLLAILNLTNTGLFLVCTLATLVVFTIIYLLVYLITSRTYYKIVEG